MPASLVQVFLIVSDVARSVQFYRNLLEQSPASENARHARFDLGPASLAIHEDLTADEISTWRVDPMPERRGWGVYLTLQLDDLEGAYRRLTSAGGEVVTPPASTSWGTEMFLAKDPDGYLLEISRRREEPRRT